MRQFPFFAVDVKPVISALCDVHVDVFNGFHGINARDCILICLRRL